MDKTEYHLKLEEINRLVDAQDYEGALTVADSIDWRRVKSVRTLCMVADIYEVNGELEKSMQMLQLAYKRSSIGKMILYRQVELALKHRKHLWKIRLRFWRNIKSGNTQNAGYMNWQNCIKKQDRKRNVWKPVMIWFCGLVKANM